MKHKVRMGRRRWRFITIAAFLLFMTKDAQCQDEHDFYYTPVERSFAQVQPPLYSNNRPSTYFDREDPYRVAQSTIPSAVQQPLYNEGRIRFPNPNYNQNPSPFQLPTGRSQSGSQYYINQPEFSAPQRQRYRLSLPHNYQFVHPASTKRPDISQIHSVAYQNDPSKPETFLGQVTINNPDIDYLQNSRFKNLQFDGNSLKSNTQGNHGLSNDDDDDNQDLFEQHRVTTYNPNKLANRQRIIKPNPGRFPHYEGEPSLDDKSSFQKTPTKVYDTTNNLKGQRPQLEKATYHDSSTEYKSMLDLEPLLEDDISDISFRELMKNTKGSFDVQVIKSNISDMSDSNPSASSMNADNLPNSVVIKSESTTSSSTTSTTKETPKEVKTKEEKSSAEEDDAIQDSNEQDDDGHNEEQDEDPEYVEYYDDPETTETPHTTKKTHTTERHNEYEDYDSNEEVEHNVEHTNQSSTESFDVVTMKPNNSMVEDENFQHFVDTPIIDQTESDQSNDDIEPNIEASNSSSQEFTSVDSPSILGQEIVSVVTTKSVVNGTISVPNFTYAPSTTKTSVVTEQNSPSTKSSITNDTTTTQLTTVTTENWIVVASVQTSRSVSGARFLPFPTVEQEEKKQILADEMEEDDENEDSVTPNPKGETTTQEIQQTTSMSTENINDKLDSIQSELSSAVLSGSLDKDSKNIEIITESSTSNKPTTSSTTTTSTTPPTVNVFTLRTTEIPTSTERSAPDPLPVLIKKFTPRVSTSTTSKPKKKLVTVMDELPPGFLPPGYKSRQSFKDKRTSTTSSTTTSTTTVMPRTSLEEDNINETQARSSGINSKNKVIIREDKSPILSKEFKPKETKPRDDLFSKLSQDSLSKFLPPGYKLSTSNSSETKENDKPSIYNKVKQVDISSFLPKNFKLNDTTTTENPKNISNALPVDISALLPPGFKQNSTDNGSSEGAIKFKVADISNLLPPGFNLNKTDAPISSSTKAPTGGIKLVFPSSRTKNSRKSTSPRSNIEIGPSPVTPKIQKGWPTRASTEFTGWPSPSTTPFSIEKLLEAQRNATATSPMPEIITESSTHRTTTTTTTLPPPPPTTPGVCKQECDIAATIKIVAGVQWVPELLDHHTEEWKRLAEEVKNELNSVYTKSDLLHKWYKGVRIDSFSKGSVLVDYFIELNDVEQKINTLELKQMFHKSLDKARTGSYVENVEEELNVFDPDMMIGDQPDEDRMKKSNEKMTKTIDKSAGKLEMGKFVMDPSYTEFIVLPKREEPKIVEPEEESFLPQWGIAVIVIAMASLLFVIIFGVTVLVNRQKSAKAKQPIPLSEDMLRELDKSHMGGFDDLHQLKDRELPYHPSGKRMSTAFIEPLAYPNPGDSWRSEWTPQLQKYMQHYTPDSGRGSQIYGASGNVYGYNGSQLYGQTGGGGSQVYGYTGEYPRSHYSRRRSDYDSNF